MIINGLGAHVILSVETIVPIFDSVERVGINLFDENSQIQVAKFVEIMDKYKSLHSLQFKSLVQSEQCDSWLMMIDLSKMKSGCYQIVKNRTIIACSHDSGSLKRIHEFEMDDDTQFNLKIVKMLTSWKHINVFEYPDTEIYKSGTDWICNNPNYLLGFTTKNVEFDYKDLAFIPMFLNNEFKDNIVECETSNCIVGMRLLANSYLSQGRRLTSTVRMKREVSCSGITFWGILGVGYNDCESGVSINDLRDSINPLNSNIEKEEKHINLFVSNVSSAIVLLNEKIQMLTEIHQKFENVIEKLEEEQMSRDSYIMHYTKTQIQEQKNLRAANSYVQSFFFKGARAFDNLKTIMLLPSWVKECTTSNDCSEIYAFLKSKIQYWEMLEEHNFDPQIQLRSVTSDVAFTFINPVNVSLQMKRTLYLPKLSIREGCKSMSMDEYVCDKCYDQEFRYLTPNWNGTNNHQIPEEDSHTSFIFKIPFEEHCISKISNTGMTLLMGSACLKITDEISSAPLEDCFSSKNLYKVLNLKSNLINTMNFEPINITHFQIYKNEDGKHVVQNMSFLLSRIHFESIHKRSFSTTNILYLLFNITISVILLVASLIFMTIFRRQIRKKLNILSMKLFHATRECTKRKPNFAVSKERMYSSVSTGGSDVGDENEALELTTATAPPSNKLDKAFVSFTYLDPDTTTRLKLLLKRSTKEHFIKEGRKLKVLSNNDDEPPLFFYSVGDYICGDL